MGVRPKYTNYQDYMKWRLDRRVQLIRDRADKVMRRYVETKINPDNCTSEEDRLWLDQFAKGNGFDIACGDFLIGDDEQATGVDGDTKVIGTDHLSEGDELAFQEPGRLDYIVTNYLEGMPYPLKALNEWWRCLKANGVLALICRDANFYSGKYRKGALANGSRQNTYTKVTLRHYLHRAGFTDVQIEETTHGSLRASARKELK